MSSRNRLPPRKSLQADELAAREQVAVGGQGEEAPPAAAGRDVAHQPPGRGGHDGQQDVGEIAHDQLAARLLVQLVACDPGPRRKYLAAGASSGFTLRERGSVQRRMFIRQVGTSCAWRKSTSFARCRRFSLRDRADHAPARVALEPVHGLEHLAIDAAALPSCSACGRPPRPSGRPARCRCSPRARAGTRWPRRPAAWRWSGCRSGNRRRYSLDAGEDGLAVQAAARPRGR